MKRVRYSRQDKEQFFTTLERYRKSRALVGRGGNNEFVAASVAIHAALGRVPKSYKRYVTQIERSAGGNHA